MVISWHAALVVPVVVMCHTTTSDKQSELCWCVCIRDTEVCSSYCKIKAVFNVYAASRRSHQPVKCLSCGFRYLRTTSARHRARGAIALECSAACHSTPWPPLAHPGARRLNDKLCKDQYVQINVATCIYSRVFHVGRCGCLKMHSFRTATPLLLTGFGAPYSMA